ncbi:MAG: hypothetical protein UR26_C0010G0012 [candidate division TM6 bacterium GW2011_GWF2_32_72]|nr:MAG: hypothetical protein UR26_C0010G0012 [candidate division TM6 bacterium GW2011_GWF2_32_72]
MISRNTVSKITLFSLLIATTNQSHTVDWSTMPQGQKKTIYIVGAIGAVCSAGYLIYRFFIRETNEQVLEKAEKYLNNAKELIQKSYPYTDEAKRDYILAEGDSNFASVFWNLNTLENDLIKYQNKLEQRMRKQKSFAFCKVMEEVLKEIKMVLPMIQELNILNQTRSAALELKSSLEYAITNYSKAIQLLQKDDTDGLKFEITESSSNISFPFVYFVRDLQYTIKTLEDNQNHLQSSITHNLANKKHLIKDFQNKASDWTRSLKTLKGFILRTEEYKTEVQLNEQIKQQEADRTLKEKQHREELELKEREVRAKEKAAQAKADEAKVKNYEYWDGVFHKN